MTTLVVTPTFMLPTTSPVSFSLYQGNGVNTATEIASTALPTRLVFDTQARTGNSVELPTMAKSLVASTTSSSSDSTSSPTSTPSSASQSSRRNVPILAIILALVGVTCISMMFLFLWYRKRARRRGHAHGRAGSEEFGIGPPAGDILRKLGPAYEKSPATADPFSDIHASEPVSDPFADPEKPTHMRSGSDSFLQMARPPYTHAPSASTGSTASGRMRKREAEEARKQDMAALNNLVRALDQKERQAQAQGRDRRSLPPVELFKAALIR